MIDNDFLNDTIENILQSDAYRNIDFLTGVTLNEGLYFAEYHIDHFYRDMQQQPAGERSLSRRKRFDQQDFSTAVPPDLVYSDDDQEIRSKRKATVEPPLTFYSRTASEQFSKMNYIQRYINANFRNGPCFLDQVRKRYEYPGKIPASALPHQRVPLPRQAEHHRTAETLHRPGLGLDVQLPHGSMFESARATTLAELVDVRLRLLA